jgi:hypothetical protein
VTTTILFLSADPRDTVRLRLGEEQREIGEKLRLAQMREDFLLEVRSAVRPADLSQALLDTNPTIVHFSGHGSELGAICLEDAGGYAQEVTADALGQLFQSFGTQTRCVVLNACFSEVQAEAIARHVAYVVGMSHEIGDDGAIAFSVGFYQAIGAGRSIDDAFALGVAQLQLRGIDEGHVPRLLRRRDFDAAHALRRLGLPTGNVAMRRRGRTQSEDPLGRQRIGLLALASASWELVAIIESTGDAWQSGQVTSATAQTLRTFAEAGFGAKRDEPVTLQQIFEACIIVADLGVRAALNKFNLPPTVGAKMSMLLRVPSAAYVGFIGDCGALASFRDEDGRTIRLVNHPRRLNLELATPATLNAPLGHLLKEHRRSGEQEHDELKGQLEIVPERVPLRGPEDFIVLTSEGLPIGDAAREALARDVGQYDSANNVGQFLVERDLADEALVACYELTSDKGEDVEHLHVP